MFLLSSYFKVHRPPFLPQKELTAPKFWRSPLPLRAAVWQWVPIQTGVPPPPPGVNGYPNVRTP